VLGSDGTCISAVDAHWTNDKAASLAKEARGEFDEAKRAELYSAIQQIIRDDGGQIIPVFYDLVHGLSDRVGTPEKVSGAYRLDGFRAPERWWVN
jgi:peptide/nickel transport system substrate-binding protein